MISIIILNKFITKLFIILIKLNYLYPLLYKTIIYYNGISFSIKKFKIIKKIHCRHIRRSNESYWINSIKKNKY